MTGLMSSSAAMPAALNVRGESKSATEECQSANETSANGGTWTSEEAHSSRAGSNPIHVVPARLRRGERVRVSVIQRPLLAARLLFKGFFPRAPRLQCGLHVRTYVQFSSAALARSRVTGSQANNGYVCVADDDSTWRPRSKPEPPLAGAQLVGVGVRGLSIVLSGPLACLQHENEP